MIDRDKYHHLYEIAYHLNKEFSLPAALRISLEKTAELLDLQTGWIWLAEQDMKSVYLAASFNLPPALKEHPERLSGWCFCIDRYLSDHIEEGLNISEITCTRLRDISSGTKDLKFHATIPIIADGIKIGLINLLSKEKQQLNDDTLSILNAISELIGIAIQRTRLQETFAEENTIPGKGLRSALSRIVVTRIDELLMLFKESESFLQEKNQAKSLSRIAESLDKLNELKEQLAIALTESAKIRDSKTDFKEFRYPASPLTRRELEVLMLVKSGLTNGEIAEQLYISERTVKFHITSILSKLYSKTRTQAVDIALKRGLISS